LCRKSRNCAGWNWGLKRKEAKHWWQKKEREASGVRVGFFELADMEEIE